MHRWIATAAIFVAAAASAQAQPRVYSAREGHWNIYNTPRRCLAVNRPLNEVNATPFNMLTLAMQRGGPLVISVSFWPGQIEANAPGRLTLRPGNRPPITVAAKAVADFGLESTEPLSAGFLQDLRTSNTLDVEAAGMRQGLSFDVRRIGFVIARLENCARLLPQQ